ncbi:MAG: thioredoxin fold domain-containing protein [Candidatus Protochlamydia sp.]|nr:thioredoxin fold domain-containing protein [Candidatus Protochlamydia sp.]
MLKKTYYFLFIFFISINPVLALDKLEIAYVTKLNDTQFESFIQTAEKPVIIDFWATWCAPCMKMKPIFEQLANELKEQYLFVSINIDEGQQIAKKYGVTSIPAFKIIKNNTVIGTFTGYTVKESFIEHIDNAIHKKTTLKTLLSAIQSDDKELVETCLDKDIDVNGISQINVMNATMPITPLMMASSKVIFWQSSLEIVSMLLKAGAQIDLEIDSPKFDKSMAVTGWGKTSVRLIAEETAKGRSEEELAAICDDTIRQRVLECKTQATNLLELFQKFNSKK